MLYYDLNPMRLISGGAHVGGAPEQRGRRTVTTIDPTSPQPQRVRPKGTERQPERTTRAPSSETEAVKFEREETSLHRLYESTREMEETSRQKKIEDLRRAVQNGTYRPNLMVVAERMLSSGELGPTE